MPHGTVVFHGIMQLTLIRRKWLRNDAKNGHYVVQGHLKVNSFGTNRKPVCDKY